MRFPDPPIEGRLIKRYKRFFADVELASGELVTAHCPNTGSLLGCDKHGARVWLRDSKDEIRKLRYTWQAIEIEGAWINVDTSLPNQVVFQAIAEGKVPALAGYAKIEREVRYGEASRVDILLTFKNGLKCFVEVKNTTLILNQVALFPDAVTERGRKHLTELSKMVASGARSVQFFFVSRSDVRAFRPADEIDVEYARALRDASKNGVEVLAYSARVEPQQLDLGQPLELQLGGNLARKT